MKRIIVTADDFGMCKFVDDAIIELISCGTLSSTNVLVNFKEEESAKKLKEFSNISIGIHWNLTLGKPVSKPEDVQSLVDKDGNFYSSIELKNRLLKRKLLKKDIERELKAQFDCFCERYKKLPIYWNTHENISHNKFIFDICCNVAKEKKIKATRNFDRVYIDFELVNNKIRRIREYIVRTILHCRYKKIEAFFKMPNGRIVCFFNNSKTDIERNKKAILEYKYDNIEMVIHPATNIDYDLFGNIGKDRIEEYNVYRSKEMYDFLHNNKIKIITFEDL